MMFLTNLGLCCFFSVFPMTCKGKQFTNRNKSSSRKILMTSVWSKFHEFYSHDLFLYLQSVQVTRKPSVHVSIVPALISETILLDWKWEILSELASSIHFDCQLFTNLCIFYVFRVDMMQSIWLCWKMSSAKKDVRESPYSKN